MDAQLKKRRLALLEEHFASEVEQNFDRTIATFSGSPRYEIMPTGQIHDGKEAVLNYHRAQRGSFPDQRHENVRFHCSDSDTIIAEFDLLGTNLGEFAGRPPTGKAFRVPTIAVFFFDDELLVNERVYLDVATMMKQIGRTDLLSS
ncbi:MAG: ester cyclase [Pseudomonadota bacterium]